MIDKTLTTTQQNFDDWFQKFFAKNLRDLVDQALKHQMDEAIKSSSDGHGNPMNALLSEIYFDLRTSHRLTHTGAFHRIFTDCIATRTFDFGASQNEAFQHMRSQTYENLYDLCFPSEPKENFDERDSGE